MAKNSYVIIIIIYFRLMKRNCSLFSYLLILKVKIIFTI